MAMEQPLHHVGASFRRETGNFFGRPVQNTEKIPPKSDQVHNLTRASRCPRTPSLSPHPRAQSKALPPSPPYSRCTHGPAVVAAVLVLRPRSSRHPRAPPGIQSPFSCSACDPAAVPVLRDPPPSPSSSTQPRPSSPSRSPSPRAPALPRALHPCSPSLLPPIEIHPRALHPVAPLLKPAALCCRSLHKTRFSNRNQEWVYMMVSLKAVSTRYYLANRTRRWASIGRQEQFAVKEAA
ncbi:vegetative cell wall protein gp1-like [Triticum urartu]|uniref:vegetative cell wall protein gp1-like n=1 Tax=Triticum urartu TaxID=4572 RepID=UPI002044B0D7|nr:vegetative cell wall protein gp1-like [Triticum urartu]